LECGYRKRLSHPTTRPMQDYAMDCRKWRKLIMAALRSRCRHYIFVLWFLLSSFSSFFFFPHLFSAVADWMSTISPNLAFSYIGSVTARHSSSGHQPNFAAWYKEWNYGTLAEGATCIRQGGYHVGHRPHILVIDHTLAR